MKATVLIYNFQDQKRLGGVKKTLLLMGIKFKMIPKEEYLRPIGQLFGVSERTEIAPYDGEELEQEMIVMGGIDRTVMDAMLDGFRKNGVGKIDIKAVLTPTNGSWNAVDLFRELKREHEVMHYELNQRDGAGNE